MDPTTERADELARVRNLAITITAVASAVGVVVASVVWVWSTVTNPITLALRRGETRDSLMIVEIREIKDDMNAMGAALHYPIGSANRRAWLREILTEAKRDTEQGAGRRSR